ncbi:MAG TPA: DUF3093 family protein [Gaiellaceae bacterium]|nr:DUF3093 family protein [Gaiellaceae bacterium]
MYRERPRCPLWIYLGFFLVPGGFFAVLMVVFHAIQPHGDYVFGAILCLGMATLCGLLPRFSQVLVVVDDDALRVGRNVIRIGKITSMQPVAGRELKRVRHELMQVDDLPMGGIGALGSALAMMSAGIALIATEDRRRGMHCSPWQEPALLVETPNLPTTRWLISAREPLRLQAAIERARRLSAVGADGGSDLEAAIAELPTELQPGEGAPDEDEGGWLPPHRER